MHWMIKKIGMYMDLFHSEIHMAAANFPGESNLS